MFIDFLMSFFEDHRNQEALIWEDKPVPYFWLAASISYWQAELEEAEVRPGAVVALEGDFSPNAVALMLALIERRCIMVPLTEAVRAQQEEFREIAQVDTVIRIGAGDTVSFENLGARTGHEMLRRLQDLGHPGLILFSSGSTGKSKAAVHDFAPLLEKYHTPRQARRTLTFLLFDHIGGLNTLLHTLSSGGCAIFVPDRSPDAVLAAVARHRVQVLPASPTFLNLLLLSEAWQRHDLSSLELVTYGTEVMPESTLQRFHEVLPRVRLLQTYGLSELGILRTRSRASDSLWVKVGGEGFEVRVVDGLLEIKARSAMLGYLNAPSPFTPDGWFMTGDAVATDGDYLKILGRTSEIINVGGDKVYPAEVESLLMMLPGVDSAVVRGEQNALTGQIVTAKVKLSTGESLPDFRRRMRSFLKDKIPFFKIPQKIVIAENDFYNARFKKIRLG
jgi:long-chain acyl-CoA synthetase